MADAPFGALAPAWMPSQPDQSQTALAMLLQARGQLATQPERLREPELSPADQAALQPETFVNPAVKHVIGSLANTVATPGRVMAPNPYPAGSEEASWYDDQRGKAVADWAPETAMTMMGGAGVVPAEANSLRMGIKAYHGSPHDFERFDLSKIGTGEGAQAYGHGLYFAENEGVAKSYRDALAAQQNAAQRYQFPGGIDPAYESAAQDFLKNGYSADDTLVGLKKAYKGAREGELEAALNNVRSGGKGRMYEVNINAEPEHFLDWDKPLSQQHPKVQEAATQLAGQRMNDLLEAQKSYGITNPLDTLTGQELARNLPRTTYAVRNPGEAQFQPHWSNNYKDVLDSVGGDTSRIKIINNPDPVHASQALAEAGIPGIKYLDQGSRFAQPVMTTTPHGDVIASHYPPKSSNYVVFNDKLIEIMRKYGLAGLPAAGVAGAAASDQAPFGALGR